MSKNSPTKKNKGTIFGQIFKPCPKNYPTKKMKEYYLRTRRVIMDTAKKKGGAILDTFSNYFRIPNLSGYRSEE